METVAQGVDDLRDAIGARQSTGMLASYGKWQCDGGQGTMRLTKTFFSPKFGMVADKFGVGWMVRVAD